MTASRRPSASSVDSTHLVLPPDTNAHGTAFGGRIMQWMDIAAGIAAARHCSGSVVTVAVDELHFVRPVRLGDVVLIHAQLNHTGRSSMEVAVEVDREDAHTGKREHCLTGYFIFVAVDDQGRPVPVPQLELTTDEEKRRYAEAERRRQQRLAHG